MSGTKELLRSVRKGTVSVEQAARALRDGHLPGGKGARLDFRRQDRTGLPEIVLAEGKSAAELESIIEGLDGASQGAVISRLTAAHLGWMERSKFRAKLKVDAHSAIAVLNGKKLGDILKGRTAAVITAGTSDVKVAEEVRGILESFGAEVYHAYDVGVAGLHRLLIALKGAEKAGAEVYVVCAGREGALPTVVAGLVGRPVVAVPISSGYGRGGNGEAALTAMLQSCAPIAVVNIDAGVPAAMLAAQILRNLNRRR
jgi:hypothetical protein